MRKIGENLGFMKNRGYLPRKSFVFVEKSHACVFHSLKLFRLFLALSRLPHEVKFKGFSSVFAYFRPIFNEGVFSAPGKIQPGLDEIMRVRGLIDFGKL